MAPTQLHSSLTADAMQTLIAERDAALAQRDAVRGERDAVRDERDVVRGERDVVRGELRVMQVERDLLKEQLKAFQRRLFGAKRAAPSSVTCFSMRQRRWRPTLLCHRKRAK